MAEVSDTPAPLEAGTMLGGYRLDERLGDGSMGAVYRATQLESDATVAVKVLHPSLASSPVFRRRFLHEARAAATVRHRHLVPLLDQGEDRGRPYIVMPFMAGGSLEDELELHRRLSPERLVTIARHVAAGLDALHRHDVLHRDVKPSNVVLDENGAASLTDLGLAKGRDYSALTEPGHVLGTLDYLAPELFRGEEASTATDIYAFGCLLYECLTGEPPFSATDVTALARAHLEDPPPDPAAGGETAPMLAWAILRALAKDARDRPPTAVAYLRLIEAAAGSAAPAS